MKHLIWVAGFLIIVVSVVVGGVIGGVVGYTMATNRTPTESTAGITPQNNLSSQDIEPALVPNTQNIIIEDNTAIVCGQ